MSENPALAYTVPDVEANLWAAIGGDGSGLRLWTVDVQETTHGWVTRHTIQVDARASGKKAAHDRAWDARAAILALPGALWDDGVVLDAAVVTGPSWLPDENGAPRYVARYELAVRPVGS